METKLAEYDDSLIVQGKNNAESKKLLLNHNILYGLQNVTPGLVGPKYAMIRSVNLGSAVTDEQWAEIKAGTFRNMFIGDYWVIGGIHWTIMDFDYYYKVGNTTSILDHHAIIMPYRSLYNDKFHENRDLSGGYAGSYMYKTGLGNAKSIIISAFGDDHLLPVEKYISNAVGETGAIAGRIFVDLKVDLPEESMIIGYRNTSYLRGGDVWNTEYRQLLFYLLNSKEHITTRDSFWTKSPSSKTDVSTVHGTGMSRTSNPTDTNGVRPVFAIYAP